MSSPKGAAIRSSPVTMPSRHEAPIVAALAPGLRRLAGFSTALGEQWAGARSPFPSGHRMEEGAEHSGGRRNALEGQLLYLDRQSLTRECFGRWFDAELEEYDVVLLDDLAALDDRSLDPGAIRAIVFNAGVECMASDLVVEWLERLRKRLPDAPIIVLSSLEDRSELIDGFGLGIRGYIPASLTPDVVVEAVRLVCAGGTFAPVWLARAPQS